MTWPQSAKRYLACFEEMHARKRPGVVVPVERNFFRRKGPPIPEVQLGHFLSLCDSTGMLQHAIHSVPDRAHGYCIDDNARALLLASALASAGSPAAASAVMGNATRKGGPEFELVKVLTRLSRDYDHEAARGK